jgi:hypothetical protein
LAKTQGRVRALLERSSIEKEGVFATKKGVFLATGTCVGPKKGKREKISADFLIPDGFSPGHNEVS